jgi:hypothetical protein
MIHETKNEIKNRLNTMHDIETTPSCLFPYVKCKKHFSTITFCINIYSMLTIIQKMSTYPHEA